MILNTQQIVLLCLLVSFVTSIATGITVISIMQQAPEPVTQTINRVIERTVESVTQQPVEEIKSLITQQPVPSKDVVTVVVNQEDQTINAVAKNENSVVRMYSGSKAQNYVATGIVLNAAGDILVDKRLVDRRALYTAMYGSRAQAVKYALGTETADFVIMRIESESNPNNFAPAKLGDSNSLKVAQSVISLSGAQSASVAIGEITMLSKNAEGGLISIMTSVNAQNVLNGSVLLNLQGDIIGMKLYTYEDRTVFAPINSLKPQLTPAP